MNFDTIRAHFAIAFKQVGSFDPLFLEMTSGGLWIEFMLKFIKFGISHLAIEYIQIII